jgi:hypothetical protein
VLHELVAKWFHGLPGREVAPEVSFSIYGERGVIDILCWHAATRSLLVIELKTDIVDAQELVATIDRKQRLAAQIARERGWVAASVSRWVIVSPSRTNRRRVYAHAAMFRAAFPADGRHMRGWLRVPVGAVSAMSMWREAAAGSPTPLTSAVRRVRTTGRRRSRTALHGPRGGLARRDSPER